MANQEHLDRLKQGVEVWNQWRKHQEIIPDLSEANLSEAFLHRANLWAADLRGAILTGANLWVAILNNADLSYADLSRANLTGAKLFESSLGGANLFEANLWAADFKAANLSRANLSRANLREATLVETNFTEATLTDCNIYGIAAWNVKLEGARQNNLIITPEDEPTITVDNLKIAQFIYLLLNNAEIREVIDTIAKKAVLILGRFTPERKVALDALKEALRTHGYLPILFDFDKPSSRDLTETVSTLAHLARFIIVDLTDPSSAPHEVATIIPQCIVPVLPLLLQDNAKPKHEYAMFHDLRARYHWVLPTFRYQDTSDLLASLEEHIIEPTERKAEELAKLRVQEFEKQ